VWRSAGTQPSAAEFASDRPCRRDRRTTLRWKATASLKHQPLVHNSSFRRTVVQCSDCTPRQTWLPRVGTAITAVSLLCRSRAYPGFFIGKPRPKGSNPLPTSYRRSRERCELPPKGLPLFSALRMASADTIILLLLWTIMQPLGEARPSAPPPFAYASGVLSVSACVCVCLNLELYEFGTGRELRHPDLGLLFDQRSGSHGHETV